MGKNKSNKSSEKKCCIFTGTGKEIENIEFKCSDGHIAVIPIDSLLSEHHELVDCSDNHNISYLTLTDTELKFLNKALKKAQEYLKKQSNLNSDSEFKLTLEGKSKFSIDVRTQNRTQKHKSNPFSVPGATEATNEVSRKFASKKPTSRVATAKSQSEIAH